MDLIFSFKIFDIILKLEKSIKNLSTWIWNSFLITPEKLIWNIREVDQTNPYFAFQRDFKGYGHDFGQNDSFVFNVYNA